MSVETRVSTNFGREVQTFFICDTKMKNPTNLFSNYGLITLSSWYHLQAINFSYRYHLWNLCKHGLKFRPSFTETACFRVVLPNLEALLLLLSLHTVTVHPPSLCFVLCTCLSGARFQFFSWFITRSSVGLCERDCVNCENGKTPGQPPLYLHFKSVAFCAVCFSLLKMHELAIQRGTKKQHLSEKFMKKGFSDVVNCWISDPVSLDKNMSAF